MEKDYLREMRATEFYETEECEVRFVKMAMTMRTKSRRDIFNYILNNPGAVAREIMDDVHYSKSQVMTTIRAMKNAGLVKAVFKKESSKNYYYIDAEGCEIFLGRMQFLMASHPSRKEVLDFIDEKNRMSEMQEMDTPLIGEAELM